MGKALDAAHDAAIVQLLKTLPEERLDGVLEAVGIEPERRAHKVDPRHCHTCGHKWLGHKRLVELEGDDPHAWDPYPPSRSDR